MVPKDYIEILNLPKRVFVVGDIHGCYTELKALTDYIFDKENFSKDDLLVFLGDFIDRGPASSKVIEHLVSLKLGHPNVIFLRGNHEDMLLGFLQLGGSSGDIYLANGGAATLASYGLGQTVSAHEVCKHLGKEHVDFFKSLDRYVLVGDYAIVHAGLNPLKDLKLQSNDDIYWIRDEFIGNKHYFEKTVVFGHTPYEDIFFDEPYKIGLDTGLVYGNMLSCIELIFGNVLQVAQGESKVHKVSFTDKGSQFGKEKLK